MCAAFRSADEWSFEMDSKRSCAVERLRQSDSELFQRMSDDINGRRDSRRQKRRRPMTHKNSADGVQRFVSAFHDIDAATTMNMRINESRRNEQSRSVNVGAVRGNSDCPGIANCRDRGV